MTLKKLKVPCFGHIFKAVFITSWIVIIINGVHIIASARHGDYVRVPAPAISIFCYLCVVIGEAMWIHHFFYPEFFLNALALPIKTISAVLLLFTSIDLLETNIEELYPSTEVTRDVVHCLRAAFMLVGVILELYVFRLCQKAHHLMKIMQREEGARHFSVRRFLSAKEVVDHHHRHLHEMKEKGVSVVSAVTGTEAMKKIEETKVDKDNDSGILRV